MSLVLRLMTSAEMYGIAHGTFYNWRSKFVGMEVNEAKRLKELEQENAKLKKLLAEKLIEVDAMKDVLSKIPDNAGHAEW